MCVACFDAEDHQGHDYQALSSGGGCCDCGDPTAWSPHGFCKRHRAGRLSAQENAAGPLPAVTRRRLVGLVRWLCAKVRETVDVVTGPQMALVSADVGFAGELTTPEVTVDEWLAGRNGSRVPPALRSSPSSTGQLPPMDSLEHVVVPLEALANALRFLCELFGDPMKRLVGESLLRAPGLPLATLDAADRPHLRTISRRLSPQTPVMPAMSPEQAAMLNRSNVTLQLWHSLVVVDSTIDQTTREAMHKMYFACISDAFTKMHFGIVFGVQYAIVSSNNIIMQAVLRLKQRQDNQPIDALDDDPVDGGGGEGGGGGSAGPDDNDANCIDNGSRNIDIDSDNGNDSDSMQTGEEAPSSAHARESDAALLNPNDQHARHEWSVHGGAVEGGGVLARHNRNLDDVLPNGASRDLFAAVHGSTLVDPATDETFVCSLSVQVLTVPHLVHLLTTSTRFVPSIMRSLELVLSAAQHRVKPPTWPDAALRVSAVGLLTGGPAASNQVWTDIFADAPTLQCTHRALRDVLYLRAQTDLRYTWQHTDSAAFSVFRHPASFNTLLSNVRYLQPLRPIAGDPVSNRIGHNDPVTLMMRVLRCMHRSYPMFLVPPGQPHVDDDNRDEWVQAEVLEREFWPLARLMAMAVGSGVPSSQTGLTVSKRVAEGQGVADVAKREVIVLPSGFEHVMDGVQWRPLPSVVAEVVVPLLDDLRRLIDVGLLTGSPTQHAPSASVTAETLHAFLRPRSTMMWGAAPFAPLRCVVSSFTPQSFHIIVNRTCASVLLEGARGMHRMGALEGLLALVPQRFVQLALLDNQRCKSASEELRMLTDDTDLTLTRARQLLCPQIIAQLLMEHPLQLQVMCAQVTHNMWRRNGSVLRNMVDIYRSTPKYASYMWDRDYICMQVAAAVLCGPLPHGHDVSAVACAAGRGGGVGVAELFSGTVVPSSSSSTSTSNSNAGNNNGGGHDDDDSNDSNAMDDSDSLTAMHSMDIARGEGSSAAMSTPVSGRGRLAGVGSPALHAISPPSAGGGIAHTSTKAANLAGEFGHGINDEPFIESVLDRFGVVGSGRAVFRLDPMDIVAVEREEVHTHGGLMEEMMRMLLTLATDRTYVGVGTEAERDRRKIRADVVQTLAVGPQRYSTLEAQLPAHLVSAAALSAALKNVATFAPPNVGHDPLALLGLGGSNRVSSQGLYTLRDELWDTEYNPYYIHYSLGSLRLTEDSWELHRRRQMQRDGQKPGVIELPRPARLQPLIPALAPMLGMLRSHWLLRAIYASLLNTLNDNGRCTDGLLIGCVHMLEVMVQQGELDHAAGVAARESAASAGMATPPGAPSDALLSRAGAHGLSSASASASASTEAESAGVIGSPLAVQAAAQAAAAVIDAHDMMTELNPDSGRLERFNGSSLLAEEEKQLRELMRYASPNHPLMDRRIPPFVTGDRFNVPADHDFASKPPACPEADGWLAEAALMVPEEEHGECGRLSLVEVLARLRVVDDADHPTLGQLVPTIDSMLQRLAGLDCACEALVRRLCPGLVRVQDVDAGSEGTNGRSEAGGGDGDGASSSNSGGDSNMDDDGSGNSREAMRKKRMREARERQRRIMAEFAARQQAFMDTVDEGDEGSNANADAAADGSDVGGNTSATANSDDMDSSATVAGVEDELGVVVSEPAAKLTDEELTFDDTCVLCHQQELPDKALTAVAMVQRSGLLPVARRQQIEEMLLAQGGGGGGGGSRGGDGGGLFTGVGDKLDPRLDDVLAKMRAHFAEFVRKAPSSLPGEDAAVVGDREMARQYFDQLAARAAKVLRKPGEEENDDHGDGSESGIGGEGDVAAGGGGGGDSEGGGGDGGAAADPAEPAQPPQPAAAGAGADASAGAGAAAAAAAAAAGGAAAAARRVGAAIRGAMFGRLGAGAANGAAGGAAARVDADADADADEDDAGAVQDVDDSDSDSAMDDSGDNDDDDGDYDDDDGALTADEVELLWLELTRNESDEATAHVQFCGHQIHMSCYQAYMETLLEQYRQGRTWLASSLERNEFYCPGCRGLSNTVMPVYKSMHEVAHSDRLMDSIQEGIKLFAWRIQMTLRTDRLDMDERAYLTYPTVWTTLATMFDRCELMARGATPLFDAIPKPALVRSMARAASAVAKAGDLDDSTFEKCTEMVRSVLLQGHDSGTDIHKKSLLSCDPFVWLVRASLLVSFPVDESSADGAALRTTWTVPPTMIRKIYVVACLQALFWASRPHQSGGGGSSSRDAGGRSLVATVADATQRVLPFLRRAVLFFRTVFDLPVAEGGDGTADAVRLCSEQKGGSDDAVDSAQEMAALCTLLGVPSLGRIVAILSTDASGGSSSASAAPDAAATAQGDALTLPPMLFDCNGETVAEPSTWLHVAADGSGAVSLQHAMVVLRNEVKLILRRDEAFDSQWRWVVPMRRFALIPMPSVFGHTKEVVSAFVAHFERMERLRKGPVATDVGALAGGAGGGIGGAIRAAASNQGGASGLANESDSMAVSSDGDGGAAGRAESSPAGDASGDSMAMPVAVVRASPAVLATSPASLLGTSPGGLVSASPTLFAAALGRGNAMAGLASGASSAVSTPGSDAGGASSTESPLGRPLLKATCEQCGRVPTSVAVCLLCGQTMCFQSPSCRATRQDNAGPCSMHTRHCGEGSGVFFLVHQVSMMVIAGPIGGAHMGSPYLDDHGEEDAGFKRGRPLRLQAERHEGIRRMYIDSQLPAAVSRYAFRYTSRTPWPQL